MRSGFLNAKKEQKKQRRSKVKEVEEDLDLDGSLFFKARLSIQSQGAAKERSRLWRFVCDEGGVCQHLFEFEILTKLNPTDGKFCTQRTRRVVERLRGRITGLYRRVISCVKCVLYRRWSWRGIITIGTCEELI